MSEQVQDKNTSKDTSDAAEAKLPESLSEEDLDSVAGGAAILFPVFAQAKIR